MIYIDEKNRTPIYQQIYEQFKTSIENATLAAGDKLPATRKLASTLCVGRNTVENAYQQLLVEGYVVSKVGSSYQVNDISDEIFAREHSKTCKAINRHYKTILPEDPFAQPDEFQDCPPVRYDFNFKNMDSEFLPYVQWQKYIKQLLLREHNSAITLFSDKQGLHDLRLEISKYLYKFRGIRCHPGQVIVCCGLQVSLAKICRLLPPEYRHIGMEEPGYDSARLVLETNGFTISPIPVYPEPGYERVLENPGIKALFITPSHQFPTGPIMPIATRMALLKWAQSNDGYIIEDDYDSEYRYKSKPVPALQSIDTDERVFYLGTFSKVLTPSLRISYLLLPPHMISIYNKVYQGFHPTSSWLQQMTLALYMRDGELEKHIRKTFKIYKERHDSLIKTIEEQFGSKVQIIGQNAGLHILLKVKRAGDQHALIRKGRERGVKVYPTAPYWMHQGNCPPDLIMLGYGLLHKEEIADGIKLLKEAWFPGS